MDAPGQEKVMAIMLRALGPIVNNLLAVFRQVADADMKFCQEYAAAQHEVHGSTTA